MPCQTLCEVRLRNKRPFTSQNKISFLCAFFEKIDLESQVLFECADFILSFLDELQDDSDMFQALMAKKKFYLQNLQKAEKFDAQLQNHNMETLLLQGTRVAFIDKADARKKMEVIDVISRAVYGKTEFFEVIQNGEEIREFRSAQDIKEIIRTLF